MRLWVLFATLVAIGFGQTSPVTPVSPGRKVIFSSSVEGTSPFSYVWYKNNQPINGETGSSLTIDSVRAEDSGTYKVRISNAVGFADSNEITIAISQAPTRATINLSILP